MRHGWMHGCSRLHACRRRTWAGIREIDWLAVMGSVRCSIWRAACGASGRRPVNWCFGCGRSSWLAFASQTSQ
ncbi:hypothetical protein VFPFJ_10894 [Purpureocillium lilacinum]|uniref:Uncharacterized protein n=1 Tax=Purpureocillium lilacinum TaxID=33203 RepID=A0A179GB49_PURLI|nr:hypothetical protein VFPFJ_10894 [Purpureocillium lilacinum]OAQ75056.1 hypothetical protein VFPFJ_10894 [Purpureocillium lilacinum]